MAMTTPRRARSGDISASPDQDRWLPAVGIAIWENLPLLLAIDLVLCLAALPALLLVAAGADIVAPLAAALTLGPLWLGAVETGRRVLAGEAVTTRRFLAFCRANPKLGLTLALAPGGALTLLLGSVRIAGGHPTERWLLAPLLLNGCLAMLAILAGLWVFPLATLTAARGRALWRLALAAAGSAPLATLGTVALAVLLWLGWRLIGPLVPAVLAAPFAIYLAALGGWWERWAVRQVKEKR